MTQQLTALRFLLILLIACLGAPVPRAQTTFEKDHDGIDREFFPRDQVQVPGGGYLISGDAFVPGTQLSRPYVMKLDALGNVAWHREYEAFADFHRAEAILPLGTDTYVLLLDLYGVQKTGLLAVNGAGDFLGARGYSIGPAELTMDDFIRTRDGGFLLVGRTSSVATGQDVALLKLNAGGGVQWYRELAGAITAPSFGANDFGTGVVEARDGSGYFVLGGLQSDAYLAKLDPDGSPLFHRTYRLADAFLFERCLGFFEAGGDRAYLIANANLNNDLFPLVFEVDTSGNLIDSSVASFPMSATTAIRTADGGFALAGGALITQGAGGLRLAKYDAEAAFEWAFQYDVQPTFVTINPPAGVIETADGGFLLSVAALSGPEPVQHVVKVDADGLLSCGATPLGGPFTFELEATAATPVVSTSSVLSLGLGFVELELGVSTWPLCESFAEPLAPR